MKTKSLNLLLLITALFLVAMLAACKKGHVIYKPCKGLPGCQVQELTGFYNDMPPNANPPRMKKTFGPDGRVTLLETYSEYFNSLSPLSYTLKVIYAGNYLYLLDNSTLDTMLVAKLDDCGRPKWSRCWAEKWSLFFDDYFPTEYSYDNKGRLTKAAIGINDSPYPTFAFRYDQYGNLIQIDDTKFALHTFYTFTYDYAKPIKGAYYEFEHAAYTLGFRWLIALGHIDFPSRHMRTTMTDDREYPYDNRTYLNQVTNAAEYVTSYDYVSSVAPFEMFITTPWNCNTPGGGGHPKY